MELVVSFDDPVSQMNTFVFLFFLSIAVSEQMDRFIVWGGGLYERLDAGDASWFPIMCHYIMKLYERFQMELMVSFDEIWAIIMPELWNEIKDDWVHYHVLTYVCVGGGDI